MSPTTTVAVTMASPRLERDEIDAATRVLESGALRSGPVAAEFERAFADFVGARHAYTCSNGTAALHLAYLSVIQPGDEVLVPAMTFFASASAVALAGGVPVFCDVDPDTFLVDLDDAAARITGRTTAICAVYLFGQAIAAPELRAFASKHGLAVVGDAAQALGSRWEDDHVGKEAMLTTHSFYPTKNLFVGEGGMVTTDDEALDGLGRLLRSHGQGQKYRHTHLGLNYRMTDVEAAIGLAQLPKITGRNARRRANAAKYDAAFAPIEGLETPQVPDGSFHSYHQYTLKIDPTVLGERDEFARRLGDLGVGSQVNYPMSLHRQQVFADLLSSQARPLDVTDELCRTVLSIPVHHHLEDDDVNTVIDAVLTTCDAVAQPSRSA